MRDVFLIEESSRVNAKIVKMMMVKDGGTKRVEIILAVLVEIILLNFIQQFRNLLSDQGN